MPEQSHRRKLPPVICAAVFGAALVFAAPANAVDQKMIDAAKKEGEAVWYTTLIIKQIVRPMVEQFEKKYPGVKVRYVRANATATANKILNEARAGKVAADVFDGTSTEPPLEKAGLVAKYVPASAAKYPAEYKDPQGYWVAGNLYFLTPGINTSLVRKADAPKTYEDLLDPRWKGKMVWNASSTSSGPGFIGNVLLTMGEQKGMAYLEKLARQKIVSIDASARQVLDTVVAGEHPIALQIFNHHTVISAAKGAPVDWIAMEPVMALVSTVSVLKDAPHPNAGRLLMDFILSEQGQKIFAAADYLPAMPSVPAKVPSLKPEVGNYKVNVVTPEQVANDLPRWKAIFDKMFR